MSEQTERILESIEKLTLRCDRKINLIVIHCSATPEGRDVSAEDIRLWHRRDRGFTDIGYHFVVRLDGSVECGRAINMAGAHCRGHNSNSIGICYIGGADRMLGSKDTRTAAQKVAIELLIEKLRGLYPKITVKKHRELAATECPGF